MNSKTARFLSRMGARGVLGQVMYDYATDGNDFFVVTADLAHASGFDRINRDYPDRLINVGIAEQNLIGVSAGLAANGTPVVATTWAMFASSRVADQVRNYMGYMQRNIKLIGMDSGFVQSNFSYSHTNPPDISIMRSIPGITIISPCDGIEIYEAVYASLKIKGPVYIRLTGDTTLPIVHKECCDYKIGKSIEITKGDDIAILATGNIIYNAILATDILHDYGISSSVIDVHTVKPLDEDMINTLKKYKMIVTVEEHLIAGGFGSSVAECLSGKKYNLPVLLLGVNDAYTKAGSMKYECDCFGLMPEQIADSIMKYYSSI